MADAGRGQLGYGHDQCEKDLQALVGRVFDRDRRIAELEAERDAAQSAACRLTLDNERLRAAAERAVEEFREAVYGVLLSDQVEADPYILAADAAYSVSKLPWPPEKETGDA